MCYTLHYLLVDLLTGKLVNWITKYVSRESYLVKMVSWLREKMLEYKIRFFLSLYLKTVNRELKTENVYLMLTNNQYRVSSI